jgi:hypothetical protein
MTGLAFIVIGDVIGLGLGCLVREACRHWGGAGRG